MSASFRWQERTLSDCVTALSGGTPSKAVSLYWKGTIPWVSCKDMKVDRVYDSEDHISADALNAGTRLTQPGSILIVVRGMILAQSFPVAEVMVPVSFNQDLKALVPKPGVESRFLFYWLRANEREIKGLADEAAHGTKRLQSDRLFSRIVRLPAAPIQRRIAAALSAYDDLLENNTRRMAILDELARALYREWFVEFRFPGHEKVRMVETAVGPVPDGWAVSRLEEVCERITDGSHQSPPSVEDGLPMASVKDMGRWGLDLSGCRQISPSDFAALVRQGCMPQVNDVLIAKDGNTYLEYVFVLPETVEVVLLSSVAILRPNGRLRPQILALGLREPSMKARLKNYVSGAAIPRVVLKDFRRFEVLVPPGELQARWAKIAEPMLVQCRLLDRKNGVLKRTRDLLLPKLVSGEIDVSEITVPEAADAS
jgi:type I restriction enzyme, S subunit